MDKTPNWFHKLNLNPVHRIAAGLGTMVIQDQQEDLMTGAWKQWGEKKVTQAQERLQFSKEVNEFVRP